MNPFTLNRMLMLGLLLFMVGLIWGVYFVGIPYQDPTPAQRAHEALHISVSFWLMGAGTFTFLSTGLLSVARLIFRWWSSRAAR